MGPVPPTVYPSKLHNLHCSTVTFTCIIVYMYICTYPCCLCCSPPLAQVDHFSKYKLVADDDDESEGEENETKKAKTDGKVG